MYAGQGFIQWGEGIYIKPPEATSEGLKFKHFLGEHTHTHPRSSVLHMIKFETLVCYNLHGISDTKLHNQ